MKQCWVIILGVLFGISLLTNETYAHGVIGKRFFPATLVVDDPFVSDELDLLKSTRGAKMQMGQKPVSVLSFPNA